MRQPPFFPLQFQQEISNISNMIYLLHKCNAVFLSYSLCYIICFRQIAIVFRFVSLHCVFVFADLLRKLYKASVTPWLLFEPCLRGDQGAESLLKLCQPAGTRWSLRVCVCVCVFGYRGTVMWWVVCWFNDSCVRSKTIWKMCAWVLRRK